MGVLCLSRSCPECQRKPPRSSKEEENTNKVPDPMIKPPIYHKYLSNSFINERVVLRFVTMIFSDYGTSELADLYRKGLYRELILRSEERKLLTAESLVLALTFVELMYLDKAREILQSINKIDLEPSDVVLWWFVSGKLRLAEGDYPSALKEFKIAHSLSQNDSEATHIRLFIIIVKTWKGEYAEEREILTKLIKSFEEQKDLYFLSHAINTAGVMKYFEGNLVEALNDFETALVLREEIGHNPDIGRSLNNIGALNRRLGHYQIAEQQLQRALGIRETVGNQRDLAITLNNLGLLAQDLGQTETAIGYHVRALGIRETLDNPIDLAGSLNNIGLVYQIDGRLNMALDYFQRALTLFEEVGNLNYVTLTLYNICKIHFDQGRYQEASEGLLRTVEFYRKKENHIEVAETLTELGLIYHAMDNSSKGLEVLEEAVNILGQENKYHQLAIAVLQQATILADQGRLTSSIIEQFPPKDLLESPVHQVLQELAIAMLEIQSKDYGAARSRLSQINRSEGLEFNTRLLIRENLILVAFHLWKDNIESIELKKDLDEELRILRELSDAGKLFPQKAKLALLQAKIALAKMDFDEACNQLELCLKTAKLYDLTKIQKLAENELEKLGGWEELLQISEDSVREQFEKNQLDEFLDYLRFIKSLQKSE